MKKFISILCGIVLMAGLAGCGSTASSNKTASSADTSSETEQSVNVGSADSAVSSGSTQTTSTQQNGSKTLVVYYSASGNTKAVAETIADAANADTFEIVPKEVYTDDDLNWSDDNSRVSKEHEDESLRDVELKSTTVQNWSDYDTILIGYPIWWGIAAWPVNNFVKNNDFTGKTVIPFCTSASSGIGESGDLLEKMAGTGNWQEGKRFSSQPDDDDVVSWVKSLDISQ